MFQSLLRRELHETFYSFTFLSALATLTALVPLSAYIQARYYQRVAADFAMRQSIHQAENTTQSVIIARPLSPLAPFFNGVAYSLPDEFRLRAETVLTDPLSGDLAPLEWLFPKIDLSFIIGVLMTLCTILLAQGRIVREREQGTLRLILASSVSKNEVLAAKLLGIILPMALALLYIMGLYILIATTFSGGAVQLTAGNLARLGASTVASLLVLMVFAGFGVTISMAVRNSSLALTVCLSVWAGVVLIWPSFGLYIASSLKPVAPWEETQGKTALQEREAILAELAEHRKAAADLKAAGADVETAWRRSIEIRREGINRMSQKIQSIKEERKQRISDQNRLAQRLISISPYGALKEILGDLCDTSVKSHNDFLASVEQFNQSVFLPASFDLLARQKPWRRTQQTNVWLDLPKINVAPLGLLQQLTAAIRPFALLLTELAVLLVVGIIKWRRE